MEELAIILIKCEWFDERIKKYNRYSLSFEELLVDKLWHIKEFWSYQIEILVDYMFYYSGEKQDLVDQINDALNYIVKVIQNSEEERKRKQYKNVIDIMLKYESFFYQKFLKGYSEKEKIQFIKNDIIKNMGDIYIKTYMYLTMYDTKSEQEKDFKKLLMKFKKILDNSGEQRKIVIDEEIYSRIAKKSVEYMKREIEKRVIAEKKGTK